MKRTDQFIAAKGIDFIPQRVKGKVKCFCGRESHARYSFFVLCKLCANHEDNDMDGLFPDPVFGSGESVLFDVLTIFIDLGRVELAEGIATAKGFVGEDMAQGTLDS
jgi:hypothetical protein